MKLVIKRIYTPPQKGVDKEGVYKKNFSRFART
jgi:hypothetical protein